ncbi:ABC transporter substrate-binding protein [Hahella sp. HN01]|nr:ABC transporter substrate-binding protein [Hahella sp. HN01]
MRSLFYPTVNGEFTPDSHLASIQGGICMLVKAFRALGVLSALTFTLSVNGGDARAAEPTVMSVNQCVDQMMGYLAPENLVSVTWLSHQPSELEIASTLRDIPANFGFIEQVLELRPDIVMAGQYGASSLKPLVRKFNMRWVEIPLPQSLDDLASSWSLMGEAVRKPEQAASIVSRLRAYFAQVHGKIADKQVRALILNANGWIAGEGNFQDAFLDAIGVINVASEQGVQGWGQVDLETLVRWRPDLLLMVSNSYDSEALATNWVEHPLLKRRPSRFEPLYIPADWLSCGTLAMKLAAQKVADHILAHERKASVSETADDL